jgi:hypothetical protein
MAGHGLTYGKVSPVKIGTAIYKEQWRAGFFVLLIKHCYLQGLFV